MALIDLFKKDQELCLQVINLENWPLQLVKKQKLDYEMKKFLKRFEQKRKALSEAKTKLSDPSINVPERAQEMFFEHSQLVMNELDNLLEKSAIINDIFLLEEQKKDISTLIIIVRDVTRKSFSILKEFANKELLGITRALNEFEDELLALNPLFEKTGFENIVKTKKLIDDYRGSRGKADFVDRKKKALEQKIVLLKEKKEKIKRKIIEYRQNAKSNSKELLDKEEELLLKINDVKEGFDSGNMELLKEELTSLRRKMINNITVMNINEQKRFLKGVEEDLKTLKSNHEELVKTHNNLGLDNSVKTIKELLKNFEVRFEDGTVDDILE